MASLTSLFHHHMSPRSFLDFFFPYTSSHAFRAHPWKFSTNPARLCLLVLIFFFQILLFGFHSISKSFFLWSLAFSQSFLEPFYPDLRPPVCAKVHMESLSHPLHTFCIFPPQAQSQFLFYIHQHYKWFFFLFVCPIKPSVCHSFSSQNSSNLLRSAFLIPIPLPPCTPSKPSAHFPTCPLKSPKETMISLELPKSH